MEQTVVSAHKSEHSICIWQGGERYGKTQWGVEGEAAA